MKRTAAFFIAMLITLSVVVPCRSEGPSGERIDLDSILSTVAKSKSFSCDFVQEKRLAMLKKPVVTRGRLYYLGPDQLRWDQKEPTQVVFVVNGKKLRRWEGKENKAETTDLAKDPGFNGFVGQVFAWHNGDKEWLLRRYEIEVTNEAPPTVRLIPLDKSEKRFISRLDIIFSKDLAYVQKVEVETKKKDAIVTTFPTCVIDPSLPTGPFQ